AGTTRPFEVLNNLGLTLRDWGDLEEALEAFRESLAVAPDFWAAWNNAGITLTQLGCFEGALGAFDRALTLQPDKAETHRNRAMALLSMGDYRRGWPEYEWRMRCPGSSSRRPAGPRWDGSDLGGKTI